MDEARALTAEEEKLYEGLLTMWRNMALQAAERVNPEASASAMLLAAVQASEELNGSETIAETLDEIARVIRTKRPPAGGSDEVH